MSQLDNVYQQQKRSQFGTGANNSSLANDSSAALQNINVDEKRRQTNVKNGMRIMNQQSSIGSFQNRGAMMGDRKYPSRIEVENFQN